MTFFRTIFCISLPLMLTACLIPEKFSASFAIKEDGSYNYKYDGTAVNALAAMSIKKNGSLPAKEDAALKAESEKPIKQSAIKKMSYKGAGRYDMQIDEDVKAGQQVQTLKIFNIKRDNDCSYTISMPNLKQKDVQEFKTLDIKINGTVQVLLPSGVKPITHNADSTPGLISKAYSWKINSIDANPSMRFKLNETQTVCNTTATYSRTNPPPLDRFGR